MKTLFLLRHAKSSWSDDSLQDFDRPLNARGLAAAKDMGRFLSKQSPTPQLIISSPSLRTRQTIQIILSESGLDQQPVFDERIYEASVKDLLSVIEDVSDEIQVLLLVGHNPGIEDLVRQLTGERREMATATLAKIYFDEDRWKELVAGEGKLEWLVRAKDLN